MILLILPLIWAAVLLPPWVLHRRELRADRSVVHFDRRMAALERSASVRYVFGSYDPYRSLPGARGDRGGEADRSYLSSRAAGPIVDDRAYSEVYDDEDYDDEDYDESDSAEDDGPDELAAYNSAEIHPGGRGAVRELSSARLAVASTAAESGRRAGPTAGSRAARAARESRLALRRRRQVFFFLFGLFVASLAAAVVLRTPILWGVHVASVVFFAGYMSLLARHQQRAAERAAKVRQLAPDDQRRSATRPAVVVLTGGSAR